jgi:hypothetical protein
LSSKDETLRIGADLQVEEEEDDGEEAKESARRRTDD